jgi:hypothetical protein
MIWQFLLDENFNGSLLRAILRKAPDLDYLRAQDIPEIAGHDDPTLLAWAADHKRVILTHDVRTLTGFAYDRVARGEPMPGVIEVRRNIAYGKIIEDLMVMIGASQPNEINNQVVYIPL